MTVKPLLVSLALLAALPTLVLADDQHALLQSGYQIVWQGEAAITTCAHGQHQYQLGALVFVCDRQTYDYPHHYGDASLLARPGDTAGYLCLDDDEDCIEGSIAQQ